MTTRPWASRIHSASAWITSGSKVGMIVAVGLAVSVLVAGSEVAVDVGAAPPPLLPPQAASRQSELKANATRIPQTPLGPRAARPHPIRAIRGFRRADLSANRRSQRHPVDCTPPHSAAASRHLG